MGKEEERKTTTDVLFGKTDCNMAKNVRTQEIDKLASSWEMVEECLLEMFLDDNEFVTLTIEEIHHNIRYVQACQAEDQIVVQLGIEEGDKTRLVEKMCMEDECMDIFYEFYNSTSVRNLESYHPVEFFV